MSSSGPSGPLVLNLFQFFIKPVIYHYQRNSVLKLEFLQFLILALNAPIATKVVCFSRLLKRLRSLNGKQCGPRSDCSYDCTYRSSLFWVHTVCSGSTLFASILNSSVMLGNCLQQTTLADHIYRCIFFFAF